MENFGHHLGMITTPDIQSANAYEKVLPNHLGLSPRQVRVEPGSGVVYVTISGVKDDSDKQVIAKKLEVLNAKNPQLSQMKWEFQ